MTSIKSPSHEKVPFNKVISFGSTCISAIALQHSKLRTFACPLDWIFSSPEMVGHLLRDHFTQFLDPEQLLDLGSTSHETFVGHKLYSTLLKQGKTDCKIFLHRNPLTPDGMFYYTRTVQRMRAVSKSQDAVSLLVLVQSSKHRSKHHAWVVKFLQLFEVLQETWSGKFELLVIRMQKATAPPQKKQSGGAGGGGGGRGEQKDAIRSFSKEMELHPSLDGKGSVFRVVYIAKHPDSTGLEDHRNLERIVRVIRHERVFDVSPFDAGVTGVNDDVDDLTKRSTAAAKEKLKQKNIRARKRLSTTERIKN